GIDDRDISVSVSALRSLVLTTLLAVESAFAAEPVNLSSTRPPEVAVPFGCGKAFPVSQAHATGSHLQNDTWAWDFRMPEGTPIVAALAGVVRLARGDSSAGGCDPRFAPDANYVVLEHEQGLETQYLHFTAVMVKPGDHVKAGQLLGFSGKTGWACGAHLHFKVAQRQGNGWNNPSVQARLAGYGDPEINTVIAAPACLPLNPVRVAGGGEGEVRPAAVMERASELLASPEQTVPASAVDPVASKTAAGGGGKAK
ncbi:MAG: M23 family metallopeptidase, partial [Myxococcaceae bacterium]